MVCEPFGSLISLRLDSLKKKVSILLVIFIIDELHYQVLFVVLMKSLDSRWRDHFLLLD